jgi:long-chain acyl-CoA synthetase
MRKQQTLASIGGGPLTASIAPSVVHLLHEAALGAPTQPALTFEGKTITYAQYAGLVAGFAKRLRDHGAAGERVAVALPNSLDAAIALFAAQAAGAQVVPINPFYTARELEQIFADAVPRVALFHRSVTPAVEALGRAVGCKCLDMTGGGRLDPAWSGLGADALLQCLPVADGLAALQYTGGTTGRSKGVDILHRQVTTNIEQRELRLPTRGGRETVLCVMPLFHVFAQAMCLYLAVRACSRLVILPRYKPEAVIEALAHERISLFPAGPTIFTGLLQAPGFSDLDFSALYACYSGSAPLPSEILKRWHAVTGSFIYEGYGQTEAGPVLSYIGPDSARKTGSVGLPLAGTDIEIVDLGNPNKVLARNERGEIRARGPQIMSGYRNLPGETAAALSPDGWLYTGDIGEIDAEGYLYIRDRKKDLVIVGGYNVYPREIDEVLHQHPDVAEVAAFGRPDNFYGEIIVAMVVLREGRGATPDDLIAHCRENLAAYKVPRRLTLVGSLPKTAAGKIDKAALRVS